MVVLLKLYEVYRNWGRGEKKTKISQAKIMIVIMVTDVTNIQRSVVIVPLIKM